jgi:hypothetical protein
MFATMLLLLSACDELPPTVFDLSPLYPMTPPAVLVEYEPAAADLKLRPDQKADIELAYKTRKGLVERGGALLNDSRPHGERAFELETILDDPMMDREKLRETVWQTLDDAQRTRLQEIARQSMGPIAPFNPTDDYCKVSMLQRREAVSNLYGWRMKATASKRRLKEELEDAWRQRVERIKGDMAREVEGILTAEQRAMAAQGMGRPIDVEALRQWTARRAPFWRRGGDDPKRASRSPFSLSRLVDSREVRAAAGIGEDGYAKARQAAGGFEKFYTAVARFCPMLEYAEYYRYFGKTRAVGSWIDEVEASVVKVLTPEQVGNLEAIRLQTTGPVDLLNRFWLGKEIGITDTQRDSMHKVYDTRSLAPAAGPERDAWENKTRDDLLAVLTEDQRRKWREKARTDRPYPPEVLKAAQAFIHDLTREPD